MQEFWWVADLSIIPRVDEIKPAIGEGMDKSTIVHTQIQIIIIHFLPSPFPPIPNG
jgi:hypothetical protein